MQEADKKTPMNKIDATDPIAQSADLVADNIAQLKALFPELMTRRRGRWRAINVDVLKVWRRCGGERYRGKVRLKWPASARARQLAA